MGWNLAFGLAVLLIVGRSSEASAQTFGADVGTIYLSGSPSSYVDNIVVQPLTLFQFYIVAEVDYVDVGAGEQNFSNGLAGWEMRVSLPPDVVVTKAEMNPRNALLLGDPAGNWLVALGTVFVASSSPHRLVTYSAFIANSTVPQTLVLRVGAIDPSTFTPPSPGFIDGEISGECFLPDSTPTRCKRKFAAAKGMTVNARVPVEAPSWSDVKSRFGKVNQ